jgi:transcriptional regulator of arginine metabolism
MKLKKQIIELITNNKIGTQTELSDRLKKEYDLNITQSNLSNILKKMNIIKTIENDDSFYIIQNKPLKIDDWIKKLIISIDSNENVIMLKTYSGAASVIGQIIDEQKLDNVMGTIAGDNMILIVPTTIKKLQELENVIKTIFS